MRAYATGAYAEDRFGSLRVAVPGTRRTHARARADARTFARSIWGPRADVLAFLGSAVGRDRDGRTVPLRRYSVVIVGSAADAAAARTLAEGAV